MAINIRTSYDSFRELRENNSYYVGKTLTMTMLRDFLDIRQDSRDIFTGLNVMIVGMWLAVT